MDLNKGDFNDELSYKEFVKAKKKWFKTFHLHLQIHQFKSLHY